MLSIGRGGVATVSYDCNGVVGNARTTSTCKVEIILSFPLLSVALLVLIVVALVICERYGPIALVLFSIFSFLLWGISLAWML